PLSGVFALQVMVGILSFILMIIFSRNALVMEIKNQLVGSAKMKKLLRVG
ncbi:colanic acid exporter, partial [Salmonella enterica]|nr:colanic acid exporter [Salmonella enterica]